VRVAVAGGTGLVGRYTLEALRSNGHETVSMSRADGVDVTTGEGLDAALAGVDAVVDATNTPATDPSETRAFFTAVSEHLLASEERAGVGHHLLLSIVDVDAIDDNAHYVGKQHQEEVVRAGPVPFTIQRATQFFEFAEMVVGWTRQGDRAVVAPLLIQPVAAAEVGDLLAEVAVSQPGIVPDFAGPELQDLVDMARRAFTARGEAITLVPSWSDGPFGVSMAGEVLLPGPEARLATTTFDQWLHRQGTP
jgi:uncharacterized protein YbjT (DUF2867 family)